MSKKSKSHRRSNNVKAYLPSRSVLESNGTSSVQNVKISSMSSGIAVVANAVAPVGVPIRPSNAFFGRRANVLASTFSEFKCTGIKVIMYPQTANIVASAGTLPTIAPGEFFGIGGIAGFQPSAPNTLNDLAELETFALTSSGVSIPVTFAMSSQALSSGLRPKYDCATGANAEVNTQGFLYLGGFLLNNAAVTTVLSNWTVFVESSWTFWNPISSDLVLSRFMQRESNEVDPPPPSPVFTYEVVRVDAPKTPALQVDTQLSKQPLSSSSSRPMVVIGHPR